MDSRFDPWQTGGSKRSQLLICFFPTAAVRYSTQNRSAPLGQDRAEYRTLKRMSGDKPIFIAKSPGPKILKCHSLVLPRKLHVTYVRESAERASIDTGRLRRRRILVAAQI